MELFKSRARVVYTNAVGDKVYPVVVDIKKGIKSTEEVTFVSSDINTGILSAVFVQGNEVYNVSGAEVVCSVMRPDASTLEIPCEVVSGNIVEVPLGVNGTSQDGVYSMDFKIFKGGNKVVGTPIMNYSVSLSIGNDMAVEEDDRLPVLTMLMTQVGTLKEEATSVISQANDTIELARVATNNAVDATNNAVDATNNANATIEEVKVMTNEAVSRVDNSISVVNNTVNEKVVEMNTAKVDMTNTVSNKINEVEKRFNNLTSSQQQSSEVIDARDGEVSLKARLDRDIEKAKEIYVGVEGTYVSTDSSSGYAKYVEILGNTIQNAENLADIRSVGDKVEGQELYEIPVVSCGKNLFSGNILLGRYGETGNFINDDRMYTTSKFKIQANKTIVVNCDDIKTIWINFWDVNMRHISQIQVHPYNNITTPINCVMCSITSSIGATLNNLQVEYEASATPYEPYQEDKLTILSPVQLEKVGDVSDRIICKDGVFGVEKLIETKKLLDFKSVGLEGNMNGETTYYFDLKSSMNLKTKKVICNILPCIEGVYSVSENEGVVFDNAMTSLMFRVKKEKIGDYSSVSITEWLDKSNFFVKIATNTPQFIPLPQDQQVKLRTFANKTNISFLTEIEGTIKAQVPKSLGATVNTHTEQINNLNKELDRVKKLEESTVSTVTTESGFTTVEETANGYFEDVKLEGKTLVNIVTTYDTSKFIFKDAIKQEDGYYKLQYGATVNNSYVIPRYGVHLYKPNTTYTIIVDIKENTTGTLLGISAINSCIDSTTISKRDFANLTGISTITFKTRDDITISDKGVPPTYDLYFGIWKGGGDLSKHITFRYWVLEGDHTQNPPSYFEGLMSVGQDVDEVSVESVNKNLFDGVLNYGVISTANGTPASPSNTSRFYGEQYIPVCNNMSIIVSKNGIKTDINIHKYDIDKNYIGSEYTSEGKIRVDFKGYIRIHGVLGVEENIHNTKIQIECNEVITDYIPRQSNKKPLLYYNNETQTWEKPVLRQWDSIEKHSDGKYYYHKRSGEVVLNGGESWRFYSDINSIVNISFEYVVDDKYNNPSTKALNLINDKFEVKDADTVYAQDVEGIVDRLNLIRVKINRSKLSTQDAQGFKAWLRANPTTVVYQLANEEVYECTNIDLITYENETNYIVSSGVIAPKTTLKVHSNISNVVKILQEKVSVLERNVKASQEVQDMMILESDMRILELEMALMPMSIELNIGGNPMLRSATYYNFIKRHIESETYSKEYLENVMNKYLATNRLTEAEYDELYKILYPPVYDIELPIEL